MISNCTVYVIPFTRDDYGNLTYDTEHQSEVKAFWEEKGLEYNARLGLKDNSNRAKSERITAKCILLSGGKLTDITKYVVQKNSVKYRIESQEPIPMIFTRYNTLLIGEVVK